MVFKKRQIPWNKKERKKFICKMCGKEFYDKSCRKRVFCSINCRGKQDSIRMKGRVITKETRKKISKINKGRIFSEEHKKNLSISHSGKRNPRWNGGKSIDSKGYVEIYSPNHPFKNCHNRVREHRLVMERYIGRYLKKNEFIHHLNNIPTDNQIKNLKIVNAAEHNKIHKINKNLPISATII